MKKRYNTIINLLICFVMIIACNNVFALPILDQSFTYETTIRTADLTDKDGNYLRTTNYLEGNISAKISTNPIDWGINAPLSSLYSVKFCYYIHIDPFGNYIPVYGDLFKEYKDIDNMPSEVTLSEDVWLLQPSASWSFEGPIQAIFLFKEPLDLDAFNNDIFRQFGIFLPDIQFYSAYQIDIDSNKIHTGLINIPEYNSSNQPLPEPATMFLFGTGIVAFVGIRKRNSGSTLLNSSLKL